MEISFCSHPNTNKVIATIFGTWHDSWAVVACAKFCCDMVISNWIRAKWNFHRIWIVMEKSLVKWAPEPMQTYVHYCYLHHHQQTFVIFQLKINKQLFQFNVNSFRLQYINFLHAKFFSRNMYLQFLSFLHTDMTQVVEILPYVRQGTT